MNTLRPLMVGLLIAAFVIVMIGISTSDWLGEIGFRLWLWWRERRRRIGMNYKPLKYICDADGSLKNEGETRKIGETKWEDAKKRLIDGEKLLDALIEEYKENPELDYLDACRTVELAEREQAIDAEPVRHGHNASETGFLCSECLFGAYGIFNRYEPKYCPNCGARMDGGEKGNGESET